MPDKRDVHKAKSHRNSKSKAHQQPAARPQAMPAATTVSAIAEPTEAAAPTAKKNKSRR